MQGRNVFQIIVLRINKKILKKRWFMENYGSPVFEIIDQQLQVVALKPVYDYWVVIIS